MKRIVLSDAEILSLRAVVYGCNTNKRCSGATYLYRPKSKSKVYDMPKSEKIDFLEVPKHEKISFYEAIETVFELLEKIDSTEEEPV